MIGSYIACTCAVFLTANLFFLVRNVILSFKSGTVNAFRSSDKHGERTENQRWTVFEEIINLPLILVFGVLLILINYLFTDYSTRILFVGICILSFYVAYRLSLTPVLSFLGKLTEKVIFMMLRPFYWITLKLFISPLRRCIHILKNRIKGGKGRIICKKNYKNTFDDNIGT